MMKIFHEVTVDDLYGQPWPPPGNGWVVVRRIPGATLWRLIQIESDPPQSGLVNEAAQTNEDTNETR